MQTVDQGASSRRKHHRRTNGQSALLDLLQLPQQRPPQLNRKRLATLSELSYCSS
jgi:hypothetical protein